MAGWLVPDHGETLHPAGTRCSRCTGGLLLAHILNPSVRLLCNFCYRRSGKQIKCSSRVHSKFFNCLSALLRREGQELKRHPWLPPRLSLGEAQQQPSLRSSPRRSRRQQHPRAAVETALRLDGRRCCKPRREQPEPQRGPLPSSPWPHTSTALLRSNTAHFPKFFLFCSDACLFPFLKR